MDVFLSSVQELGDSPIGTAGGAARVFSPLGAAKGHPSSSWHCWCWHAYPFTCAPPTAGFPVAAQAGNLLGDGLRSSSQLVLANSCRARLTAPTHSTWKHPGKACDSQLPLAAGVRSAGRHRCCRCRLAQENEHRILIEQGLLLCGEGTFSGKTVQRTCNQPLSA